VPKLEDKIFVRFTFFLIYFSRLFLVALALKKLRRVGKAKGRNIFYLVNDSSFKSLLIFYISFLNSIKYKKVHQWSMW